MKDHKKDLISTMELKQNKSFDSRVNGARWVHYLLFALLFGIISLSFINTLWPLILWRHFEVVDYPLHSTMEALGAISAILVAFMPLQVLFGKSRSSYVFLSAGFLVMGLLDLFHSSYKMDQGFVFTHSIALLAGGLFFALFIFPWKVNMAKVKNRLLLVAGIITILLGVLASLNREIFPVMVNNGVFTPTANNINLVAALFFLISAIKLLAIYIQEKNLGLLILAFTAISSAIVGFTFQYSEAWVDSWWLWHIIRLITFLTVLGYTLGRIQTISKERNEALENIKENHELLMKSEERFRLVNEATSHGLWDWDVITNEVYFSPVWKMQVGYRDDELENDFANWVKLLHPEDKERSLKTVDDYLKNPAEKFIVEFRFRHKEGHYVWIHNEAASVIDEKGNVTRMFGAHTDITKQKEAEEYIKQSEKKFRGLFVNDPSAIFIADPETGLVYDVNPAAEKLMEMSRDELIGMHQSKLHPEDIMQEQQEKFNKLQNQPSISVDSEVLTKAGKRKPVEIKVSMVEIENKLYILGIFHDVSKLIEGQQKLRQSEEKHRSIFESATDAFIIASMEGKIVEVNPSACKMYGYDHDEMIGKTVDGLIHPDYHYKFAQFIKDLQDRGYYEGETVDVRKNLTTLFTEVHGSIINFNNQKHMLAVIRDVSEKKEQENELILKDIVYESSVAANSTSDLAGNLTSINQSFLNAWGYNSESEVLGKPIPIFIKYENEAGKILAGLTTEGKWQGTYTALKKDGSTFIAQANASVLYNSDGEKIGYQSSVYDVTEAIEADQKLRTSEEKFRNLFNSVSIPLCHVRENGKIDAINNRFISNLGYTLEDIPTIEYWWEKAYPDKKYREWVMKNWDEAVQHSIENRSDIKSDVYNVTCKNGEVRQIIIAGITFGKDVLATFIDVTEQREAEEAIIREKEYSDTVINALPGIFYLFNDKGKYIKWNKMLEELSGFSPQEIAERSPLDYFADYHKEKIVSAIEAAFKEGESSVEGDLMVKGKIPTPFYFTGRTIQLEGKPHLLGVGLDISQRKKAEKDKDQALYQLNKRMKEISCLVEINEIIRNTEVDIPGVMNKITHLVPKGWHYPEKTTVEIVLDEKTYQSKGYAETKYYLLENIIVNNKERGIIKVVISNLDSQQALSPFCKEEAELLKTIAGNISIYIQRVESELAIRESEENFRNVYTKSPVSLWKEDWTDIMEMIDELKKEGVKDYKKYFNENRQFVNEALTKVVINDVNQATLEMFEADSKDDLMKSLEVVFATEDTLPGFIGELVALAEGKEVYETEMKLNTAKGNLINTMLRMAFPSHGMQDGLVLVSIMNITELKKVQEHLKILIGTLQRSNEELEQFAYVASHDLQEPLRMVSSYTQLLERRYKDQLDERADKYIHYAVDGANRMQNLINDLLDFSRISSRGDKFVKTDTNTIIKNVLKTLEARIDETGAQINIGKLPAIMADSGQIERLFLNLVSNALKFRKPDVNPVIDIDAKEQESNWLFNIKDNGIGIDEKFKEKVFVIFQRLHGSSQYKGTGIGLAICKRIVQRHEGEIWFESRDDKGTTFHFTLKKNKSRG